LTYMAISGPAGERKATAHDDVAVEEDREMVKQAEPPKFTKD